MQRRDEYDLVALDYCVTYGVLPPPWQEPQCRWAAADQLPPGVPQAPAARVQPLQEDYSDVTRVLEWPAAATLLADDAAGHTLSADWLGSPCEQAPLRPLLSGTWRAEEPQALAVLDAACLLYTSPSPRDS